MIEKPFIRTNKAEFYRLPDGSVVKRYFTEDAVDRFRQDRRSLLYIQENFGEIHRQGWCYRTVNLHESTHDHESLRMEHVSGSPLSAVPKTKMKIAEYRCGIWLALYHNKMLNGSPKGLIYTDLNAHNIILDFEQRKVTAIDPGMTWGRSGYIYEDIVKHINSALTTLVLRRKSPFTAMMSFLRGYAEVIQVKLNLFLYYKGLYRELKRQFRDYSKKSYLKFASFALVVCALSPLYYVWLPGYLHVIYLLNKQGVIDK